MGVKVREKPAGSGVYWIFINHNGQRKSKRIGTDLATAQEVANKISAKLILGEFKMEIGPCPTFKEHAEFYLSLPHDWKPSTRESYEFNLKKHIYPVFAKMRLDEIGRKDIKTFLDRLSIKGLSPATIGLIKAPMNNVFNHATENELIENNPMFGIRLKSKQRRQVIEPLTDVEADKLLEAAKEHMGGHYYPFFLCSIRTGMRLGEMRALKWKDIDFSKRQIEVRRSYRRGFISTPKTGKRRRVDMTPQLTETLKVLQTEQKRRALKKGVPFSEWVFTSRRGGIHSRRSIADALKRCCENAKLRKIRVHDLRHTYATIRLMRGHNVGDVSYQLGHSSIKMTYDVYTHWAPGRFQSRVDELDNPHPNAPHAHPETVE